MANLGLGVNLENEVLRSPEVVDFLICITFAAATTKNKYTTFPFDGPQGPHEEVSRVLKQCPRVEDMAAVVKRGESLRDYLERFDKELYKIVRWIIASNTSHIIPVSKDNKVKSMPDMQFLLQSSTPAAEARFQELKAQH
eukprot:gene8706-13470_t